MNGQDFLNKMNMIYRSKNMESVSWRNSRRISKCVLIFSILIANIEGYACEKVENLSSQLTGNILNLSWTVPDSNDSPNSPFSIEQGVPEQASDSLLLVNAARGVMGVNAHKSATYTSWVLDDFNLINKTKISSMNFYIYQKNRYANPSAITGVYVKIYRGSPALGGILIWGSETKNCLNSCSFSKLYRNSEGGTLSRPILKVEANIDTELAAGNYWFEVSFDAPVDNTVYAVTLDESIGNGYQRRAGNRFPITDNISGEQLDICFSLHGTSSNSTKGFNVYKDGNKLTNEPLEAFNWNEILTQNGTYEYELSVICGNGSESEREKINVIYDPTKAMKSLPWVEDFETAEPERLEIFDEGVSSWKFHTQGARLFPSAAISGDKFAYFHHESKAKAVTRLILPALDCSDFEHLNLSFSHYHKKWGTAQDHLKVLYRTDLSKDEWVELAIYNNDQSSWKEETISLPNTEIYQLAFEGTSQYGYGVALDNVSLTSSPGKPLGLEASVASERSRLTWKAPLSTGGHKITGYTIQIYKEGVFDSEIETTTPATGYIFSTLETGKSYSFKVSAKNTLGVGKPSEMSNTIIANTSGIEDLYDEQTISFYPNPTTDRIIINVDSVEIETLRILSLTGMELIRETNPTNELSLSGLIAGTYLLEIKLKDKTSTIKEKIIKK